MCTAKHYNALPMDFSRNQRKSATVAIMLFLVTLQKPIYIIFLKNVVNKVLCFTKGDFACEMVQCKRNAIRVMGAFAQKRFHFQAMNALKDLCTTVA
jgi:hypothetical protein